MPSAQESWYSTGDSVYSSIVSAVSWTSQSGTTGNFLVTLAGPPFGDGKYEVITNWKSNRTTTPPSGNDND